jgi:two-component system, OmpR family, phosphate regulon sensor histidine kinase PhoR
MSPVIRAGLVAPAVVAALAAGAWLVLGAGWALLAVALGAAALVAYHLRHLERLLRWAEDSLDTPVPEAGGAWRLAFSALHRRARTRNAHQRDLADTAQRFRDAAEAIPDGMVVLDPGNHIGWANRKAQAHFGLDLAHDVGRPLTNLVRQPEVIRYLDGGDFTDAAIVDSQRVPGLVLSIQLVPFGIDQRLLMSRDVTRLEAVARMRRDFIANVSHELKTPLTVISGFLETLQDIELEPRRRERYLGLMQEQARSMERLVDDLLTLSALESEQNLPDEAPFPIAPLLTELAADARALSDGQHTIAVESDVAAVVTGSRDELGSAFGNLVSNAIRYTPAGGTITLSLRRVGGDADFSVADTGIGIAAEHLPRLTERFYRVDRSRSRATGGTGLGLAIVKHVLLRHQAELAIASEPGVGSTFTVRLPASRVEWVPASVSTPGPASTRSPVSTRSPG